MSFFYLCGHFGVYLAHISLFLQIYLLVKSIYIIYYYMKSNKKITKLVIPAAGMGTRFLPATKSLAKEMLSIINVPAIHYIVTEALKSGIEQIIIVVSSQKNSIIDYFDSSFELETRLKENNKLSLLKMVQDISNMANVVFARQKKPNGLGAAINCARQIIGDEPFAVILGDDLVFSNGKQQPAIKQCIDAFNKYQCTILGVQEVPKDKTNLYGIVKPKDKIVNSKSFMIQDMVEKPDVEKAPSQFAALGRYVLTPDIFDAIDKCKPDKSGEIQLTEALKKIIKKSKIYACNFEGKRYDVGSVNGYLQATLHKACEDEKLKEVIRDFIKENKI